MVHSGREGHQRMTNEARRLSYDPDAADRVRRLLSGRGDVVEKTMVGRSSDETLAHPASTSSGKS
jgi:hypothetical protein